MVVANHHGFLLSADMGTGKTFTSIITAAVLAAKSDEPIKIIILCPMPVMGHWPAEFRKYSKIPFHVVALDKETASTKGQKVQAIEDALRLSKRKNVVIVVNYETVWRKGIAELILDQEWDLAILDEIHRVKNHDTKIGRFCSKLRLKCDRRLGMTGTPIGNSDIDIFGQALFLRPDIFGTRHGAFVQRYAEIGFRGKPRRVLPHLQVELREKIDSFSFGVPKSILDLPDSHRVERDVVMSDEATKQHDSIRDGIMELGDGRSVEASIVLAQMMRAQQITGGFVGGVGSDKKEVLLKWQGKADVLKQICEDVPVDQPIVVFARFKTELDLIEQVAKKQKRRYAEISGRRKDGLTAESEMSPNADLVGAQIQAGGTGISLVRANVVVWWSLDHSANNFSQAESRVHRPGQENEVVNIHLIARHPNGKPTIDEEIMDSMASKLDLAEWYRQNNLFGLD